MSNQQGPFSIEKFLQNLMRSLDDFFLKLHEWQVRENMRQQAELRQKFLNVGAQGPQPQEWGGGGTTRPGLAAAPNPLNTWKGFAG